MSVLREKRLSVRDVATALNVSPQAVGVWIRRGVGGVRLPALRVGSTYQIVETELEQWLRRGHPESAISDDDRAEAAERACAALGV